MTYPRRIAQYPEEFNLLLEKGYLEEVQIPFESYEAARRFRGRFYAFIGAVRREAESGNPLAEEMSKKADRLQLRLAQGSNILVLQPIDKDADAAVIRGILNAPKPGSVPGWLLQMAQKKDASNT